MLLAAAAYDCLSNFDFLKSCSLSFGEGDGRGCISENFLSDGVFWFEFWSPGALSAWAEGRERGVGEGDAWLAAAGV